MGSKGGKTTTKVITPTAEETAGAQSQANLEAIYASTLANRYNEETPFGSVTWERPQPQVSSPFIRGPELQGYSGFGGYGISLPTPQQAYNSGEPSVEDLGGWTRKTTLSPELQRQFDLQNQLAENLQGSAVTRSGQLPNDPFSIPGGLPELSTGLDTSGLPQLSTGLDTSYLPDINQDFQQSANDVEQATFQRIQQLLNPQFDERQRQLESQLAATGNPLGSEGYQGEIEDFRRSRNEADLAAALESVGAGRQEQSRLFDIASRSRGQLTGEQLSNAQLAQLARQQGVSEQLSSAQLADRARQQGISEEQLQRNQNLNELSALIQGSPAIGMPQSAQPGQMQMAPADFIGAQQLQTQTQLQNAINAQQASNAKKGGTSALAGTIGSALIGQYSDQRLKSNIVNVGKLHGKLAEHDVFTWEWNESANGLGLFGRGVGVIADLVEQYAPNLISIRNGYKLVNYGAL